MARKKKKQKATQQRKQRQQKKQQRRNARVRDRGVRSSRYVDGSYGELPHDAPDLDSRKRAILNDASPLFPRMDDPSSADPEETMERFMMAAADTSDLVKEPEFEHIVIDPMSATTTFMKHGEDAGIGPDDSRDAEEQEDAFSEVMEKMVEDLLTDEMKQEILAGVNRLRLRFKKGRRRNDVPRVAALQMMLELDNSASNVWAGMGLIRGIINRSLDAGFTLAEAMGELEESTGGDVDEIMRMALGGRLPDAINQQLGSFLRGRPALQKFLENQTDTVWNEGTEALFRGELLLDIFADEEREQGAEILAQAVALIEEEGVSESEEEKILSEAVEKVYVYVEENFPSTRLGQVQQRLDTMLQEFMRTESKWMPFMMMLKESAAKDPQFLVEETILGRALMGEIRASMESLESQ